MHTYDIELTDTFAGGANYSWVRRASVTMPELTHYGYDGGTNYTKADKVFRRELMRKAKRAVGESGVKGSTHWHGSDHAEFRPHGGGRVMFVTFRDA